MPQHVLEPDAQTLHGYFSPEMQPILTIDSGDSVRLRTLDAGWGLEPPRSIGRLAGNFQHHPTHHCKVMRYVGRSLFVAPNQERCWRWQAS